MKSTIEYIHHTGSRDDMLYIKKYIANYIDDIDEALYFAVYKWYQISNKLTLKKIQWLVGNKNIDLKYVKNRFKMFGIFEHFDGEVLFLKSWKKNGKPIIPRNFIRDINHIRSMYNHGFEKFKLTNAITLVDKLKNAPMLFVA